VFRYLKAAFWAAPEVAPLGRLPVNVIVAAGFAILGFGHPGFWLLGLAVEASYLYAMVSSLRFRKIVDAERMVLDEHAAESQRLGLVGKLSQEARKRLVNLEAKCEKVTTLERDAQVEDFVIEGNREAMRKLQWLFLKVLLAQHNLKTVDSAASDEEIRQQIAKLRNDVNSERLSASLRESMQATLELLDQRLANSERKKQSLAETESDLARIEAMVDLAVDNAGMRGANESISTNIELVSQLMDDSIYGESRRSIAALDRAFEKESL